MLEGGFDFSGRLILVTGASSGIGRAVAVLLSRLNARVHLVGRDTTRLHQTLNMLAGKDHSFDSVDLTHTEQLDGWLAGVSARYGRLFGLVHSAGCYHFSPIKSLGLNSVEELFRINVTAAIFLIKAYRQRQVRETGGSITLISSAAGMVGSPGVAAYGASKGAIRALTKSAAVELAREGIRVNCVVPGYIETEMSNDFRKVLTEDQIELIKKDYPLGLGKPEDVGNAVAFLASPAARWITGAEVIVDGGLTAR